MSLLRKACELVARKLPVLGITRDDDDPYLDRYFPLGHRTSRWGLYLHHVRASDSADELHNHPWNAVSFIPAGGYSEDRLVGGVQDGRVVRRWVGPGRLNIIRAATFHRLDLHDAQAGCWTLFLRTSKVQSWGFLDPQTRQFRHWTQRELDMRGPEWLDRWQREKQKHL